MNNFFVVNVICWRTRNWRHARQAITWCKDYGLKSLTNNVYIGKLKKKERERIEISFKQTFIKKTENYYLFSICKSCYESSQIHQTERNDIKHQPFEIV